MDGWLERKEKEAANIVIIIIIIIQSPMKSIWFAQLFHDKPTAMHPLMAILDNFQMAVCNLMHRAWWVFSFITRATIYVFTIDLQNKYECR